MGWRKPSVSSNSNATRATGRRDPNRVYVVELSKDVRLEPRFKKATPARVGGKPRVYVGMTGLDSGARFDKHKAGIQSNRFVKAYGPRLLPELHDLYGTLSYEEARAGSGTGD
jgi:hypothetical protein